MRGVAVVINRVGGNLLNVQGVGAGQVLAIAALQFGLQAAIGGVAIDGKVAHVVIGLVGG